MSALDPSGPSQPTQQTAYETPGNAASKNPSEQQSTAHRSLDDSKPVDQRIPSQQASEDQANPSALGRGVRGAGAGEEAKGLTDEDVGRHKELDAQQMAAPGEGRVADAVAGRGTNNQVGGEQEDLAAGLDKKKAEQAEAREAIKKQKGDATAAGGAAGQQSAPANPVGNDNYPNSDKY